MTDPDKEMAREIKTSNGYTFIVDADDYERVSKLKWNAFHGKSKKPYIRVTTTVRDSKGKRNIYIGRFILGIKNPLVLVDHINRNPLDNRKCNLRTCNSRENSRNRKLTFNGEFSGVHKEPSGNYRASYVGEDGKKVAIGFYPLKEDAAIARDAYVIKHYGGFAHLNFPILKDILESIRQQENEKHEALIGVLVGAIERAKYDLNWISNYGHIDDARVKVAIKCLEALSAQLSHPLVQEYLKRSGK